MTRDLILKPALGIYLKFKTDLKKGMGDGRRGEILNFPSIRLFFYLDGLQLENRQKKNSEKETFFTNSTLVTVFSLSEKYESYSCQ